MLIIMNKRGLQTSLPEEGFGYCYSVTSARDERGTGQGWPLERNNSPQNPANEDN